jgi:hypothetical protein
MLLFLDLFYYYKILQRYYFLGGGLWQLLRLLTFFYARGTSAHTHGREVRR